MNEYKQNHMKGRQRGRNGGGGGGGGKPRPPGRNPNFDGNNNRPRGNAQQLMEKYLALARDASSAGDRVLAENYFQHADHYYRVLNARFEQQNNNGQQRRFDGQGHDNRHDRQGNYGNQQPYEGDHHQPQHMPSSYQQQSPPPQPHHHTAAPENEPQPGHEAEIALPPGILGEAPPVAAESQDAPDVQEGGGETRDRGRQGSRRGRGRGRGDRPVAIAGAGE